MGLDLNKNFGDTISTKLRHEMICCGFIRDLIDNNQDLKRLFRYMSISPLASKSTTASGEVIIQKDLKKTLTTSNEEGNQTLFHGTFDLNMSIEKQTYCFIHTNGSTFKSGKEGWDSSYFNIEIIIPTTYDLIKDDYFKMEIPRGEAIGIKIADMLEGFTLTNDKSKANIGNPTFNLISRNVQRLSNTSSNVVYSYVYKASFLNGRIGEK